MSAIGIVLALSAAACAFGLRILRPRDQLQFSSLLERAVFATALGLGAAAYLILALGLAGALYPWTVAAIFVVLAAIGGRGLVGRTGSLPSSSQDLRRPLLARLAWWGRLAVCHVVRRLQICATPGAVAVSLYLAVMLALATLGALAPSSVNDWDGLSYHLAVPKIYLERHAVEFLGWVSHSNFPFTLEMLYAAGLALQGQAAAKLFHTLSAVLVVLALVAFGGAHWQRRHGALAAAVFLTAPVVAWEATVAFNDLAAALYTLLALYAFVNWWCERGRGWLAVAGAMCGFALGVKMTALVLLGFLAVAAFYHRTVTQRDGSRAGLRAAAVLVVIAAALASPWYIKSYLWTGNPVYPFLFSVFGGKYWTAEAAHLYRQEQLTFGMGRGPLGALLAPWNLTMYGHRFSNFPERPLIYTSLGPLFLALLPGLALLGRLDRRVKFLLAYSLVGFGAWFVLSQHIRYAIPVLPAVALAAGFAGGEVLARSRKEARAFVIIAIALSCVLSLGIFAWVVSGGLPVVFGAESEAAYLTRTLGGLYAMAGTVNALPPRSKVILYGETRGFYFDTPYMWGSDHHHMLPYDRIEDAQRLLAALEGLDVTHVLMTGDFLEAVQTQTGKLARLLAESLEQRRLAPVARHGNLFLFELREPQA